MKDLKVYADKELKYMFYPSKGIDGVYIVVVRNEKYVKEYAVTDIIKDKSDPVVLEILNIFREEVK